MTFGTTIATSNDLDYQDDISNFNLRELRNRNPKFGRHNRPNLFYSVFVNPNISDKDSLSPVPLEKTNNYCIEVVPLNSKDAESCWRWGKSKFSANCSVDTLKSNLVARRKNNGEFSIFEKYRKTTYKPKSIWNDNSFLTETGTVKLRELGLEKYFDFPKPVNLIKECLRLSTVEDDLILDFFAGSCSTAQAVFELNQEDDRNRRFIMVQLPEIIDERKHPEAAKEFHTIANVGKERIRRVIAKMHRESEGRLNLSTHENQEDLGFKVFKLSRSNYRAWQDYQGEDIQEIETLFDGIETPLIDGWDKADLMTEILLMQGFPLDSTIIRQDAFTYNDVQLVCSDACAHHLFVCLNERIEDNTIEQSRLRPEDIFVCLDSALTDHSKMRLADVCNLNVI